MYEGEFASRKAAVSTVLAYRASGPDPARSSSRSATRPSRKSYVAREPKPSRSAI
jgi:hypothetical protein